MCICGWETVEFIGDIGSMGVGSKHFEWLWEEL